MTLYLSDNYYDQPALAIPTSTLFRLLVRDRSVRCQSDNRSRWHNSSGVHI